MLFKTSVGKPSVWVYYMQLKLGERPICMYTCGIGKITGVVHNAGFGSWVRWQQREVIIAA